MTRDKAQKEAIRARMAKTGERYTTARHYLLDHHRDHSATDAAPSPVSEANVQPATQGPPPATQDPPTWVAQPGLSEAAVRRATGNGWEEWITLLDEWDGTSHTHAEIARHLYETYGIDGWWAQGVTVGYERVRGMRAVHQRPDGFSVNASKTFPVPAERLFAAIVDEEQRERWLQDVTLRLRTSQPPKSARFDVFPGETRLNLYLTARGAGKATAQLQHERLPQAEDVERWRAFWKGRLARLAEEVNSG
jgi:hypothetical protein